MFEGKVLHKSQEERCAEERALLGWFQPVQQFPASTEGHYAPCHQLEGLPLLGLLYCLKSRGIFFLLKASPPMHSAECCFCPRETNKKNKSQATDVHIYSLTLALACKCLKFQPGIGTRFLSLGAAALACSVCTPCASMAPCPLTVSITQTRA